VPYSEGSSSHIIDSSDGLVIMLPVEPLEDLLTSLCTLRVIQDIEDVVLHQSKLFCICYAEQGKKQAEVCEGYHIVWKVWYIFYLI